MRACVRACVCVCVCVRGLEHIILPKREREKKREKKRETDRQTDRERDRDRDTQTERQSLSALHARHPGSSISPHYFSTNCYPIKRSGLGNVFPSPPLSPQPSPAKCAPKSPAHYIGHHQDDCPKLTPRAKPTAACAFLTQFLSTLFARQNSLQLALMRGSVERMLCARVGKGNNRHRVFTESIPIIFTLHTHTV